MKMKNIAAVAMAGCVRRLCKLRCQQRCIH